tara:strand:- start:730 stop:2544 length:1815 start_codon:yes stop_codon:yes gene_type:complete
MSKIEVNTVDVKCGSTLTLGSSGKTVTIASGASTSGMGRSGTVDWQTSSIKTDTFTASDGEGYFVDTSDGSPFKNYTVTVTTGTLYIVGGSGNVYHLDGSQQTAITMLANKTYRFTQSDSSNDGHQLIISTSNSTTLGTFQAGIVSSGITYYIDGSATQSNWLNSTTFNAGTTRYVEYKPTITGTYYFGCYNHGIGMGGAITVSQQSLNLPSGTAGNIISVADYKNTFDTNNLTIIPNGSQKIGGTNANATLSTQGQSITLVYVDDTEGWKNVQDSTSNVAGSAYIIATGGTETISGDCKIHTFTSPGTFTVSAVANCAANNVASHLIVAGGGGGAAGGNNEGGGGGGAGGYREVKNPATPYTASPLDGYPSAPNRVTLTTQAYPIVVGAGGASNTNGGGGVSAEKGNPGSNSSFGGQTATAGGGGGAAGPPSCNPGAEGLPGGSGGGSGAYATGTPSGNTPPTTPAQGNNGGTGQPIPASSPGYGAGGGGGAGAGGTPALSGSSSPTGGPGGNGVGTEINPAVGTPGPSGPLKYFSGGGGGGKHPAGTGDSSGGDGGGAPGSVVGGSSRNATANTGGGGGGVGETNSSGSGGSGIVVIRYRYQ